MVAFGGFPGVVTLAQAPRLSFGSALSNAPLNAKDADTFMVTTTGIAPTNVGEIIAAYQFDAETTQWVEQKTDTTIENTNLGFDATTNQLTLVDQAGSLDVDLTALSADDFLATATFDTATSTLNLTRDGGTNLPVNMSGLLDNKNVLNIRLEPGTVPDSIRVRYDDADGNDVIGADVMVGQPDTTVTNQSITLASGTLTITDSNGDDVSEDLSTLSDGVLTSQAVADGPNSTAIAPTKQITNTITTNGVTATVVSDEFAVGMTGPLLNPDDTPATSASVDVKTPGALEVAGDLTLPNIAAGTLGSTDQLIAVQPDGTTKAVAAPSSATVASSVENKLLVKAGNAGKSLAVIGFDAWAGSGVVPTMGGGTNANCQIVPLSSFGGIWKNGLFLGNVTRFQELSLEVAKDDKIYVPGGFTGVYAVGANAWQPMLHTGFGAKEYVIDVFRSATSGNPAQIAVLAGDAEAEIALTRANGTVVYQGTLQPNENVAIDIDNLGGTSTRAEYRLIATGDVSIAKMHNSRTDPYDCGIVFPASSDPHIGWCKSADLVSFDDEPGGFEVFVRDGNTGSGVTAFGSAADLHALGADSNLAPNGAAIVYPQNRIAANAGADSNGGEVAPWQNIFWLPNDVGIPCLGANRRVSIASPFEGTAFLNDGASHALTRTNTTDQRHPAANRIDSATVGGITSNVPINVVVNLPEPDKFYADPATSGWAEETIMFGRRSDGFEWPIFDPATGEYWVRDVSNGTVSRA